MFIQMNLLRRLEKLNVSIVVDLLFVQILRNRYFEILLLFDIVIIVTVLEFGETLDGFIW